MKKIYFCHTLLTRVASGLVRPVLLVLVSLLPRLRLLKKFWPMFLFPPNTPARITPFQILPIPEGQYVFSFSLTSLLLSPNYLQIISTLLDTNCFSRHSSYFGLVCPWILVNLFFKDFIYLLFERGREGERGETHQCVVASCTPPTGDLTRNPKHVLWVGIKPATLWFAVQCSIHWATPARAESW